jgi:alpha-1,3-mannosyltransferase
MRGLDASIVVSEHDRDLFARICPRLLMISDGIDYDTFSGIEKNIEPGRMISVGRLAPNKRVDRLLRAFATVSERVPTASLTIIGGQNEGLLGELRSLAAQLGVEDKVEFAGITSDADLHSWLSRAHLFVSASEYESFGVAVLEAMSSSTVPVVNDIAPFRAVVTPGENGFLTDFADPAQAGNALLEALSLDQARLRELGESARQGAEAYSWESIVTRLVELYRQILVNG